MIKNHLILPRLRGDDFAHRENRFTSAFQYCLHAIRGGSRHHGNHADATIKCLGKIGWRKITRLRQPAEDGGQFPGPAIEFQGAVFRNCPCRISGKAAAGDVREGMNG
jgi:hypothetical protein